MSNPENVFDEMMSASANIDKPTASTSKSTGGRPMHDQWYGYKKVQINGRSAAKCMNCLKSVTNTGKARLAKHR